MNRTTRSLAGLLSVALTGTELAGVESLDEAKAQATTIRSAHSETLVGNPHVHFELDTESVPTTASPIFASGAYAYDRFTLHVRPAKYGYWLIGIPRFTRKQEQEAMDLMTGRLRLPTGRTEPSIYGYYVTAEQLKALLARLGRPPEQIELLMRNAVAGLEQEIGGYGGTLTFPRHMLESVGIDFRSSHC